MSDQELFMQCKKWGREALEARRKFLGLLPEVQKRNLYAKKGFSSIFEFAFKLAGASEEQVRVVLNLEKRFEDKPILRAALVKGEISANKLVRVAALATFENQASVLDIVRKLPKTALETFVRDEKQAKNEMDNGFQQGLFGNSGMPGHLSSPQNSQNGKLELSAENEAKLLQLQAKGIDINSLIAQMLAKREAEIAHEKEQIAEEQERKFVGGCKSQKMDFQNTNVGGAKSAFMRLHESSPSSRYVPAKVVKILRKEYGEKCAIPSCSKPAQSIHHSARFAIARSHDPRFMAPLCKEHHLIAHAMDARVWEKRITSTA